MFDSMILQELTNKEISAWQDTKDEISWVKEILIYIYAYDENYEYDKKYVEEKAQLLLKEADADLNEFFPHWPSSLNGMIHRYQAYTLATVRRPLSKMIGKLNKVWSGQKVIDVAKKSNAQRTGLQRAVIDWRNKINLLRFNKVPDELIKVALGLEFLPVRKSGGAAKKKFAQANLDAPASVVGGGVAPPVKQRSGARPPSLRSRKALAVIGCEAADYGGSVFRESCGSVTKLIVWAPSATTLSAQPSKTGVVRRKVLRRALLLWR